jgi:hypothetical protein
VIDNLEQKIYPYEDVIANPEEASKSPDFFGLFYRFIGEQGAERLDNAQEVTTRIDNLNVAREMEKSGKEAKAIKLATGWERGADGKWRYETHDFKRFDKNGELHPERRRLTQEEQNELKSVFKETLEAFKKGSAEFDKRGIGITEYTDMAKIYIAGGMDSKKARRVADLEKKEAELEKKPKCLDDYIDDDELFAAYPDLREVEVKLGDANAVLRGKLGKYNPKDVTITLYDRSEDVMCHEVQHVIQDIEGFARGGSPNEFYDKRTDVLRRLNFLTDGHLLEDGTVISDNKSLENALNKNMDIRVQGYENYRIRDAYSDVLQRISKQYGYENIDALVADYENLPSAFEQYNRLGGEVEARNAAKRMSMTDEERRASFAAETEDVAREDQIFLQDGSGISEMGSRTDAKAAQIKEELKDVPMDKKQRAIVDVFTYDSNKAKVKVTREDGTNILVIFKKGMDKKAGTKHSLFGHFGDVSDPYSASDLLLIPKILQNGKRDNYENNPKRLTYSLNVNGETFIVATDIHDEYELFVNFYRKRKPSENGLSNTQESAHARPEDFDGTKLQNNFETANPYTTENDINTTQTTVGRLSQELGVEIVTINDASEAEGYAKATPKRQAEMQKSKGWYDPVTGKIYVVGKQHTSVADVERTVWHEAVGHRGVHGLLGDRFTGFCDRLFKSLDKGMQSALHRTHDRKEPLSDAALGAEYIAEIAEKGEWRSEGERNVWYKTVRWVRQQMMLMGFSFVPTEDDIRYMLYTASKKGNRMRTEQLRQQAVNSHDEMQDAMQMPTLDRPSDAFRSRTAGMTDRDIMTERELAAAVDAMKNASERRATAWQRGMANVVDYMHPVARFMQRLMGVDSVQEAMRSNDYNNAYMKQEAAASKTMDRVNRY